MRSTAERFGARFVGLTADVGRGPNQEARARRERRRLLGPEAMTGHVTMNEARLLIGLLRGAGATVWPWRQVHRSILALRRARPAACAARSGSRWCTIDQ